MQAMDPTHAVVTGISEVCPHFSNIGDSSIHVYNKPICPGLFTTIILGKLYGLQCGW